MSLDTLTGTTSKQIALKFLQCLIVIALPQTLVSYPVFGTKRYARSPPAYIPISVNVPIRHVYPDYRLPDYEDNQQDGVEYTPYPAFVPYYGYAPIHSYYPDDHRRPEYGFYDDSVNDPMDDLQEEIIQDERSKENTPGYPYGQETWFEGSKPRSENNAEANAAFLQNLIIAQMYQDAAASAAVNAGAPSRYAAALPIIYSPLGEEDRPFATEIPAQDEQVKQLESLRNNKNKDNKNGKKKNKNKSKNRKPTTPAPEVIANTADLDAKYGDNSEAWYKEPRDYVFGNVNTFKRTPKNEILNDLEQELNKRSRKQYYPVGEGLSLDRNQFSDRFDQTQLVTSKPLKTNGFSLSDRKNKLQVVSSSTEAPVMSTPLALLSESRRGMKEEVLLRPANAIHRPLAQSRSSSHRPSVYETIKQLMSMEETFKQPSISKPPQKRFVSNENQLVAELSGLKKMVV